ncbi:hypothetical protein AGMMS49531_09060 [Endomicrobiia bacterium]|nr:hypothetical protein AGMMS49531_09060 [Endomicrobiia bacterium]
MFLKLLMNNTLTIARIKTAFIETDEDFDVSVHVVIFCLE